MMQKMMSRNHAVVYGDTKTIPEVFRKGEVDLMIATIAKSEKYPKNIWGEWMKVRDISILLSIDLLGLRPNEACSLHRDDFDFDQKTVHIRGKNNKQRKDRILPIPDKLSMILSAYFKFPQYLWKGSGYLFPSMENDHLAPQRWKHIFREKVLKPMGKWVAPDNPRGQGTPKFRSYNLRATRATELLDQTKGDIFSVVNFLGHADLRSVKKYLPRCSYFQDHLRYYLNKIDQEKNIQEVCVNG
jgi:integrase